MIELGFSLIELVCWCCEVFYVLNQLILKYGVSSVGLRTHFNGGFIAHEFPSALSGILVAILIKSPQAREVSLLSLQGCNALF